MTCSRNDVVLVPFPFTDQDVRLIDDQLRAWLELVPA